MELGCYFCYIIPYGCIVKSAWIKRPNTIIKSIRGTHREGKSNANVKKIHFGTKNIVECFPRGLHNIFPGLTCLKIESCGLKTISRADFTGLDNLEELCIEGNLLTSLPNNLFQGMTNLKFVSFDGNKLSRLSSKLLKPFGTNNIEYVGFQNNTKIDSFYDAKGEQGSTNSLEELMDIIDRDCKSREITLNNGIQELWTSGRLSDFTIIAGGRSFNVHKYILAIHSSVFMAMFENDNKLTREGKMIIKDFRSEVVEEFLCYIYTGEIPDETNAMDLFAIAAKYNVLGLMSKCEKMILKNTNVSNAFEVLVFGNLYGSENMKELAFIELKKMFPGKSIPDEIMNQPERLKEIVEALREVDRKLATLVG